MCLVLRARHSEETSAGTLTDSPSLCSSCAVNTSITQQITNMEAMERVGRRMELGEIYRRAELVGYSRCLDRDLRVLVEAGELWKLWRGTYYRPEYCASGRVPPDYHKMLRAFLRSDDFLIVSPSMYNSLRVGTTQLYNIWLIYNHKRSGRIKVLGQSYHFFTSRRFPRKPDLPFHYVDLINNLRMLEEDHDSVRRHVARHAFEIGVDRMQHTARTYGKPDTIRFFEQLQQGTRASKAKDK